MPLPLTTSDGSVVRQGELLGQGGEAGVFSVIGREAYVLKLFREDDPAKHAATMRDKEAKIRAMLASPPTVAGGQSAIAWPETIVLRGGRFAGYLMRRVEGRVLFVFHNPKERRKHCPNFNWFYLHRTASNLASVMDAIHRAGHIIADVNDQNFLVRDTTLVAAVDTDSYQIRGLEGRWHLCGVGRPEFTPPELQGKPLGEYTRGVAQDHFALAVMIFQLLMEGSHPFRAQLKLAHSVPEAQLYCITHGHFPYAPAEGNPASPPPNSVDFSLLDPALQEMFRRCFVTGHAAPDVRPSAREWRETLVEVERKLIPCANGHFHLRDHTACPWCARDRSRGMATAPRGVAAGAGARRIPTGPTIPVHVNAPVRPALIVPPGRPRPIPVPVRAGQARPMPRPGGGTYVSTTRPLPTGRAKSFSMIGTVFALLAFFIVRMVTSSWVSTGEFARLPDPGISEGTRYYQGEKAYPQPLDPSGTSTGLFSPKQLQKILPGSLEANPPIALPGSGKAPLTFVHAKAVQSVAFHPSKQRIATAGDDGLAILWDVKKGVQVGAAMRHDKAVHSVAFNATGELLVTASADCTARTWSAETGMPAGPALRHSAQVNSAVFQPSDQPHFHRILTASRDNSAQTWDPLTAMRTGTTVSHGNTVLAAAYSPDGKSFVTASSDRTARVWNAETGQPMGREMQHENWVTYAGFNPNGRWVVTASWDHTVRLWDVRTGLSVAAPFRHPSIVHSAAFSPDGRWVITSSLDQSARIWEAHTGRPWGRSLDHPSGVRFAVFAPDGKSIATACEDGIVRIWPFDPLDYEAPSKRQEPLNATTPAAADSDSAAVEE